jgi:SAM-dependent methyltransferase
VGMTMTMLVNFEDPGTDLAKPMTVQKRIDILRHWLPLENIRILDAGCGGGGYVEHLSALGARAEGIEFNADKVMGWTDKHPGDTRVRQGDLAHLDYPDDSFDAVFLNEVLEHVQNEKIILAEILRVTKPGGKLFLFSPNRFHPFETHGFFSKKTGRGTGTARTFLLPYLPTRLLPPWLSPWARNYWPGELRRLVASSGFRPIYQTYVWQTLENNSGYQPRYVARLVPFLRKCFAIAERLPVVKRLGVSQLVVAQKQPVPKK